MAALDQCAREPETTRSFSALQTLKNLCTRTADDGDDDDDKSLAVSLRSAVLGGLMRGRAKRAGGDSKKAKRRTKTAAVSREEKGKQQQQQQQRSTEARHDATSGPPTPPPSENVSAESSPREAADFSSLSLDAQDQDQEQEQEQEQRKEEPVPPMRRRVSFNEVVMEIYIEDRHKTYGSKASRRQHFYTKTELAIFKRTWYWHVKASSARWPVDRLLRCGCPGCDRDEGRVPVDDGRTRPKEDLKEEYSHWTWEG